MSSGSSSTPPRPSTPAPAAADLARALAGRIDDLVAHMEARHPPSIRAWLEARPELVEANRAFTRDSMLTELDALAAGARIPEALGDVDAGVVRMAARLGAPLEHLLWGYRNGHRVQWEGWLQLVDPVADATARRELLELGADFFFAYVDRLSDLVTAAYTQEREQALRGREQRRAQAVGRLLDGAPVSSDELGYDVAGWHLGLIAWGGDGPGAIRALGRSLDRQALVLSVEAGVWWGWLGGRSPLGRGAGIPATDGTCVAVGTESRGAEGFRSTHREAGAAYRAGRRSQGAVTRFDEVALEALAGADEPAARAFCSRELSGLEDDDARSVALRQTLRAWFAHDQNAAATAAALGVHEQTVAARLRAVEERTGRPPARRRAELETALRLRDHLGWN